MNRLRLLYQSTIGKKFIAAVTGLILFGFLIGHVAGNLKVFTGSTEVITDSGTQQIPHIDEYGHFLRVMGAPILPAHMGLWATRMILLLSLILHVHVVAQLALLSAEARPVSYVKSKRKVATLPALWMMFSGVLILGFIVFHILHLTVGVLPISSFEHGQVYNNLQDSFIKWPIAIGYVAVMMVLGFHLYHGVWSLFQTMGLDNPDRNGTLRAVALIATLLLVAGFCAVPIAFALGWMPDPVTYDHDLLSTH